MMSAFGTSIKEALGQDIYVGLLSMFVFLHFYYGVPSAGWTKSILGFCAVLMGTFILSVIGYWLGNGFRSAIALISSALTIDFFFRSPLTVSPWTVEFEYLWNGPAVVSFASFGFAAAWIFSQLTPRTNQIPTYTKSP